jgi:flavin-binding protein dodecin
MTATSRPDAVSSRWPHGPNSRPPTSSASRLECTRREGARDRDRRRAPGALTGRDPQVTIALPRERTKVVTESVYKIIELVGTSTDSWEKAATAAVAKASGSLRDLRIAEVAELDLQIEDGEVKAYRARLKVSFKYED